MTSNLRNSLLGVLFLFLRGSRRFALRVAHRTVKFVFLNNKRYYYSGYYGCDHALVLLVKNILRPGRFYTKLRYGLVPFLPKFLLSGNAAPEGSTCETRQLASKLREDGFLVFNAANPELADYISEKYRDFIASTKPGSKYSDLILGEADERLLSIITNEKYLRVISDYYRGRQPYLRATGSVKVTRPVESYIGTRSVLDKEKAFNTGWHYDTVNMIQIHFLLHDLEPSDTHMKLVKAAHRRHRVNLGSEDYYYSDEYIVDNYPIVPFCGEKGTVIIWDSNSPHRAHPVAGRCRSFLQLLYSPGNDILTHNPKYGRRYALKVSPIVSKTLSSLCKNSLAYVLDDQCSQVGGSGPVPLSSAKPSGSQSHFEVSNF